MCVYYLCVYLCCISHIYLIQNLTLGNGLVLVKLCRHAAHPPDHSKGSDIFNLRPHKQHTHGDSKGTQMSCMIQILHLTIYTCFKKRILRMI